MRSLTPTGIQVASLNQLGVDSYAATVAIDPESGTLFVAVETKNDEGGVEVQIVRLAGQDIGTWNPEVIGSFTSPVLAPFPIPEDASQTLDLHYFADDRSLVVLLYGGDIATLQLEGPDGGVSPIEVVGSIDSGIKGATWSPDDEQLVIITGEDNLVCMTRMFDVIHEEPLHSDDFGDDKFINVGWGSKTTQFHGSLGKKAAIDSSSSQKADVPTSLSHPTDTGLPSITFRGDAAFFAVSSLDAYSSSPSHSRRQVRIYSRDPSAGFIPRLSATSESIPGLEGSISWRPSGNVLSGLVRYGYEGGGSGKEGRWDVAMLERNGLRHGGFELREQQQVWKDGRVKGISWNSDSEVLAIWIERVDNDVVQLWTMKNYHYYLKQEIFSHTSSKRLKGFKWHSEQALSIYIVGQDFVQMRTFAWDTYVARLSMPNDTATVCVVDGDRLLVTPFRSQNVPPPMSSYTISLPSPPTHISHSLSDDTVAALLPDGTLQVWDLNTRLPDPKSGSRLRGGGKVAEPKLKWEVHAGPSKSFIAKQVAMGSNGEAAVLFWVDEANGSVCKMATVTSDGVADVQVLGTDIDRILADGFGGWYVLDGKGSLRRDANDENAVMLCAQPQDIALSVESSLVFALSSSGKLHYASILPDSPTDPSILASSVTSFVLTPDFLIYTTSTQTSYYAPLKSLRRMAEGEDVTSQESSWETRRIERGALAVVACPSSMSLVLQMPRGNLETIYPRPLVLAVVRRDVMSSAYRAAFVNCRKHRLDLNVLYDLAPAQFMNKLEDFVAQIPEVDYLNLFVSALNENDVSRVLYQDLSKGSSSSGSKNKVNTICDALRSLLEKQDLVKYVETILTTHVCKSPPDYEAGLRVLLQLQADHPTIVEDAIKYIIFLSEVDKLYDVALGMYNFQLVLMIAQYSKKDPKEYLPFLRELRALDKHEQRFRIDDHLERRESALRNLHQAGPSRFEEAASYLARYELYDEAFKLYADDAEQIKVIYDLYGDYLYDRRDFIEAASSYTLGEKPAKALKAYEKAHAWRELFTLALQQKLPQQALVDMWERVTDHLSSRGRHLEASQIFIDYARDVDSAVEVLKQGSEFGEAFRIASKHEREDLVESVIYPGLEDAQEALGEVFEEMEGQLDKEMKRLDDLRAIREDDPDAFYIVDTEPALEGVDVATNATTVATAFTRYTVAPTTVFSQTTRMTGQTAKSRHKASRKRAAGRKGTVDEYEYLLASIGRLVIRVDEKSAEAITLLRHLVLTTEEHRGLAKDLQESIVGFRRKLGEAIEEAWRDREDILGEAEESGGMGFGGGDLKVAREVLKPSVQEWRGLGVLLS